MLTWLGTKIPRLENKTCPRKVTVFPSTGTALFHLRFSRKLPRIIWKSSGKFLHMKTRPANFSSTNKFIEFLQKLAELFLRFVLRIHSRAVKTRNCQVVVNRFSIGPDPDQILASIINEMRILLKRDNNRLHYKTNKRN